MNNPSTAFLDALIRAWDVPWWVLVLSTACPFLLGYVLGSIPFGLVFTRLAGAGDIRTIGSGNIGATNVLRTGRKGLAAATLLFDALKGTAAVLLGYWLPVLILGEPIPAWPWIAAFGAFIGHLFPVWLKFKGGKGVATFLGCLLALSPWTALSFAVIWLSCAVLTRYSSLSALIASAAAPFVLFFLGAAHEIVFVVALMAVILIWKHKDNIKRLMAGTEGKIGKKG